MVVVDVVVTLVSPERLDVGSSALYTGSIASLYQNGDLNRYTSLEKVEWYL